MRSSSATLSSFKLVFLCARMISRKDDLKTLHRVGKALQGSRDRERCYTPCITRHSCNVTSRKRSACGAHPAALKSQGYFDDSGVYQET